MAKAQYHPFRADGARFRGFAEFFSIEDQAKFFLLLKKCVNALHTPIVGTRVEASHVH